MSIPTTLGTYPVERELGRGGMGVVYLARDPRLNRPVAIKIVPEALANNPDNMARFEREARLLAAVNHPNIASIYSVEDVNGQRLLVMEYIAGESLADRLRRGPLPIDEALDIARQMAAAVEAAHEGGIVHRDLKPGNVRVTPDGTVKVLDFGLAKGLVTSDAELAQSPTLTYSPTGLGVILGTAGYMSPEQARGKPVDRRADVWAFGCVLFECFTGKKTFEGETVSDTIARILEREPLWADLPPATPSRVRELLRRCLEKDLKRRQRDMGDVRLEIEEALAAKSSITRAIDIGPGAAAAPARRATPAAFIAAIGLLVGATAGIGIWNLAFASSRTSHTAPVSLSLSMPASIRATGWSFARGADDLVILRGVERRPDGTEDPPGRLFARRLGSFELRPIAGSEGSFGFTRSPDGRDVVVWKAVSAQSADSRLVRLSVDGTSPPLPIAEWDPVWRDMIWLSDGDLLVLTAGSTRVLRIPTTGGAPKAPVAIDLGGGSGFAQFEAEVAGGAGVLIRMESWGAHGYQQDIWLLDPTTGKATKLVENGASPRYVASTGHLFFSRGPALMAVRFDPATKAVIGDAVGLFDGLRTNLWSSGDFSLSEAGHLLFEPGGRLGTDRRLVTVNAAHEVVPFVADTRSYEAALSASHDGKQVAVVIPTPRGTFETWIAASDRSGLRRTLSFPNADATNPTWSPKDEWLAFERNGRDKDDGIYVQKADGSGGPRLVWKPASNEESFYTLDWTHDGSAVLVGSAGGPTQKLIAVPVAGGGQPATPTVLIAKQPTNAIARLSPDGRYLVFQSTESGSEELHLAEMAGSAVVGRPLVITSGGGEEARWSADSTRVYYRKDPGRVMSVTIARTPALHVSAPVLVQDLVALRLDPANWDILRDGRLIGIERGAGEDPTTSFSVVLNWLDLVRAKLPK